MGKKGKLGFRVLEEKRRVHRACGMVRWLDHPNSLPEHCLI